MLTIGVEKYFGYRYIVHKINYSRNTVEMREPGN